MSSMRLTIAQGLVALLQGVQNAQSQPLYNLVKLGAVFDPSPYTSWCEVVDPRGKTGHAGSGGNQIGWRIEEDIVFKVTSGFGPYEADSSATMTAMLTAQDIVMPMWASHYQIPAPNNPAQPIASVYSLLESQGQTDMSGPVRFPNGHFYLLWNVFVLVKQQYNVTLSTP